MEVPEKIDCVDCGRPAYRLSYPPEEGWQVGDYVAYRCSGCNDRWDMEVSAEVEMENSHDAFTFSAQAQSILRARRETTGE